jgi:hypothetical protein
VVRVVVVRILVVGKCRVEIMNTIEKPVLFLFMTYNIQHVLQERLHLLVQLIVQDVSVGFSSFDKCGGIKCRSYITLYGRQCFVIFEE